MLDLTEFEKQLQRERKSPETIRTYLVILTYFFKQFKEANQKNIEDFIDQGTKEKKLLAEGSINTIYAALKKYFKWKKNPLYEKLHYVKTPKRIPYSMTNAQIKKILETKLGKTRRTQVRNHLLLALLYSGGFRRSEICKLTKSDLKINEGIVLVRNAKGKKDREVMVSKKWMKDFLVIFPSVSDSAPLFPGPAGNFLSGQQIWNIVQKASISANVLVDGKKPLSPHKFRSTHGTHLYDQTGDIYLVKEQLGHEHIQTTTAYARFNKERFKKIKNPLDEIEESQ